MPAIPHERDSSRLSVERLRRFIEIRNNSGHRNNLQFTIDALECGFNTNELGEAQKTETGYEWQTPFGWLIERHGCLSLQPFGDGGSVRLSCADLRDAAKAALCCLAQAAQHPADIALARKLLCEALGHPLPDAPVNMLPELRRAAQAVCDQANPTDGERVPAINILRQRLGDQAATVYCGPDRRKAAPLFIADCDCGFPGQQHADGCPAAPEPTWKGPQLFNSVA